MVTLCLVNTGYEISTGKILNHKLCLRLVHSCPKEPPIFQWFPILGFFVGTGTTRVNILSFGLHLIILLSSYYWGFFSIYYLLVFCRDNNNMLKKFWILWLLLLSLLSLVNYPWETSDNIRASIFYHPFGPLLMNEARMLSPLFVSHRSSLSYLSLHKSVGSL